MKAVIDVREWQTIIDMKSGYPCPFDGPQAEQMRRIAAALPYPGDRGLAGIEWVFRGAKTALAFNDPQWLCLDFTQPYFSGLHRPEQPGERAAAIAAIVDGIERLAAEGGFAAVIVGSGRMAPRQGMIETPDIGGILQGTAWVNGMAGIYHAEPGDLELARRLPHVQRVVAKEEMLAQRPHPLFLEQFPDLLLIAESGWCFKGFYSNNIPCLRVDCPCDQLPVYSQIGWPEHIEEIYGLMRQALAKGQKVLLAVIEGIDGSELPQSRPVGNRRDWYCYGSYSLYYTLVSGKTFYDFELPPLFDMTRVKPYPESYPFSMPLTELCADSLGRQEGLRTAAVGSRSMVTHSIINADFTIECFIRSLANMGVMVALND